MNTAFRGQCRLPDSITAVTGKGSFTSPGSHKLVCEDFCLSLQEKADRLTVSVTAGDTPLSRLVLRWSLTLGQGCRILGGAWERGYGDLEWRGFVPERVMPWYFLADSGDEVFAFGVMTQPKAMCFWTADSQGVSLHLDLRSGGEGVVLQGRRLTAAQVLFRLYEGDAFAALERFCSELCPSPLMPDHPVYGSNNWYYAYGDSSHEEILQDASLLASLTWGLENRPYMVNDDGWQAQRTGDFNGGPWRQGNSRFPNMAALAAEMEARSVRPGIWMRPLWNRDPEIPAEWRLQRDPEYLDPSLPAVLDWISEDIRTLHDWGYRLIKHDFSTFDLFGKWGFEANLRDNSMEKWHFYDQTKTSAEIVKMLYQEIYDASRSNNAVIIGCNTIGHLGAGLMHLNRTGDDTSGRIWERTRRMGVNTLAFRLPQHNTFYHIDADCVGIFGMIPWEKNRQWADVLAKSGTPLFVSAKPGVLNPEEFEELHQIMLRASEQKEHFVPLDWEEIDCPEVWGENGETITYDWFDNEGPTMDATVEYYNAKVVVP